MNMENLEAIISILGLLLGGSGGAFFTWRFMRRKAKAEAVTAEVDAAKDLQDMYQQMLADAKIDREDRKQQIDELRQERDHYKSDRNELRTKLEETDGKIHKLELDLVRLTKIVEGLRPFLCADLNCQSRKSCIIEEMNAS